MSIMVKYYYILNEVFLMQQNIYINSSYITLGQLLKLKNIVQSGGQVKDYLSQNHIKVNNILENRRGRKLQSGDVISIFDTTSKKLEEQYLICISKN